MLQYCELLEPASEKEKRSKMVTKALRLRSTGVSPKLDPTSFGFIAPGSPFSQMEFIAATNQHDWHLYDISKVLTSIEPVPNSASSTLTLEFELVTLP
ncbi:MAG: hypothetical protein CMO26_21200 [Thiotrichales bacterium]|nr:hypothetical protein [Thiotrichales bacterium]